MKDATSFYCNLDYLLVPIQVKDLSNILKHGFKPTKPPKVSCLEAQPLLTNEEPGIYAVSIFKQWRAKHMEYLNIDSINPDTDIVIKLDKSVVLYVPFHFNKTENQGRKGIANTLYSDETSNSSIWKYDVVKNINNIMLNEIVFHETINPAFIKEVWYFTGNEVPHMFYNEHYRVKFVNNNEKLL